MFLLVLQKTSMSTRFTAEKQESREQTTRRAFGKVSHSVSSLHVIRIRSFDWFFKVHIIIKFWSNFDGKIYFIRYICWLKTDLYLFLGCFKKTARYVSVFYAKIRPISFECCSDLIRCCKTSRLPSAWNKLRDTLAHAIHSAKHGTESCIQRGEEGACTVLNCHMSS